MGVSNFEGDVALSLERAKRPASPLDIRPASFALGAEIHGLDLSRPLEAYARVAFETALAEYGVLVFRNQSLTPEAHVALAEQLGGVDVNRFFRAVEGYPQIAEVRKEAHHKNNIGGGWHADHSYDDIPAKASILYAKELPERGGDTMFASAAAAFNSLSYGLKSRLQEMRALHSSRHVFGAEGAARLGTDLRGRIFNPELAVQDAAHPAVFVNPVGGRSSLYVNPGFTVRFEGWTEEESKPLLDYLYAQVTRPEFTFRLAWRPGTVAIWDNRTTWHRALNDYDGQRRLLHRVTVAGESLTSLPKGVARSAFEEEQGDRREVATIEAAQSITLFFN